MDTHRIPDIIDVKHHQSCGALLEKYQHPRFPNLIQSQFRYQVPYTADQYDCNQEHKHYIEIVQESISDAQIVQQLYGRCAF